MKKISEPEGETIRVLIVDDHAMVRQGLRTFLELHRTPGELPIEVVAEVSDGPAGKLILGMRGTWTDAQTFTLDYNEIASPNALALRLHFDSKRLTLDGPGINTEGKVSIEGWQE